ncbi:MAG: YIP1 family protein [Desulfomonile tiedjei]|nr:YIP1 family protein [Desulfomonile tiedjei]
MGKPKVSAKAAVADIRAGLSDSELMEKYGLSPQGLQSLFRKLIENNLVSAKDISRRATAPSEPVSPPRQAISPPPQEPEGGSEPAAQFAQTAADLVRQGCHDNELMVKLGLSPSQLRNLLGELVQRGYLSAADLEARRPGQTKKCPGCGGILPKHDTRCQHCGKDLTEPIPLMPDGPPEPELMPIDSESISEEKYCAWEESGGKTMSAYIQTATRCLVSPSDFFSKLPLDAGYGSPTLFSIMSMVVAAVFTVLWFQIFKGGAGALGLFSLIFVVGLTFVFSLIFIPIFLLVSSLIVHGILTLLQGAHSGFQATFRVAAYSSVTTVFSAIPVVGQVASLWGLYLGVIGLRETHETSTGKAAAAVMIPVSVLVLAGLLLTFTSSQSRVATKSTPGIKGTASTHGSGQALPAEVCQAIGGFIAKVESARALGTMNSAKPKIQGAMEELDRILRTFEGRPRIEEVRGNAGAFAGASFSFVAIQETVGNQASASQIEQKLDQLRSALQGMCAK